MPKVSLKNEFPWVPTRRVEYPHGPFIIPMGSLPCAWPRSQATLGSSYPCAYIVRTPPPDSYTHSLPKKRVFPGYPPTLQGTHMVLLQLPWGGIPALGPCLWQQSAAGCPKTHILGPTGTLSPKVSLKNEFSLGTQHAGRVPTWSLYNTHGVTPLRLAPFSGYTGVIPLLIHSQNTPRLLYPQSP